MDGGTSPIFIIIRDPIQHELLRNRITQSDSKRLKLPSFRPVDPAVVQNGGDDAKLTVNARVLLIRIFGEMTLHPLASGFNPLTLIRVQLMWLVCSHRRG